MKKLFVLLAICSFAAGSLNAAPSLKRAKTVSAPNKNTVAGENVMYEWNANPPEEHVTGYHFYEHLLEDNSYKLLGSSPAPAYTVTNLSVGTHRYVVTAYRESDNAEGLPSDEAVLEVSAPLPPLTPPTNLHKVINGIANVSTRAQVGTGENVEIGGFIISGEKTPVVVRAIGPSLTRSGISGALIDPTLELHDASGAVIATNDNWQSPESTVPPGLVPKDYRESVITTALDPGAYTAILRGKNETRGIALFEVYRING